jgi:hypothetical protein
MAENQEKKNNRELIIERLSAKYPEREWVDDEALFGQVGADYDDYDNQLNGYKEREGKLEKLFAENPRAAQFVSDMAHGKDPWIGVIEFVGSDGVLQLMNDPEKKEALDAANKAYAERLAEQKRLEEEYEKNQAEAIKLREQLDAQYGEEVVDAALAVIDQIFKDALVGKVTPETFDMALKVVRHDSDVDNARSEGVIAGRNAKIEEGLRKRQGGDGMPAMGGSSAAPVVKKRGFFDDLPKRKFQ